MNYIVHSDCCYWTIQKPTILTPKGGIDKKKAAGPQVANLAPGPYLGVLTVRHSLSTPERKNIQSIRFSRGRVLAEVWPGPDISPDAILAFDGEPTHGTRGASTV